MSDKTSAVPNPGSQDAVDKGCTCAVIDNHHGRGVPTPNGRSFWISGDCSIHAKPRSKTNG